jgi:Ribonuclease G/E
MSKDKPGLGDVEYPRKIKTQTFKQFQLERLIKYGTVIPASKLAEAKDLELQRSRDTLRHSWRHITAELLQQPNEKLKNLPHIRERYKD